ncbi:16267_t:CDS:2, partial [Gigaspora margarita]
PRGTEGRNIVGAGYREQKYKRESEKGYEKGQTLITPKDAKGEAIKLDQLGPLGNEEEIRKNRSYERFENTWEEYGSESCIDYVWYRKNANKAIEEGIIQAAEKTLPKKKCAKEYKSVGSCEKIRGLQREAQIISKLCRKYKQKNSQGISDKNNKKIQIIFEKFGNEEQLGV